MVQVGCMLVCGRCLQAHCHAHYARYQVRYVLPLAILLTLLTYTVLYTRHWEILQPLHPESDNGSFRTGSHNCSEVQHILTVQTLKSQLRRECDVLKSMTRGKWIPGPYTRKEMDNLNEFIGMSRAQHGLPPSLERPDRLCGNVTFSHLAGMMHNLLWFRALCDPQGPHPCCYHNRCTSGVSVQECRCPDCYDLRQPIHAEHATWVPSDPVCKIKHFHNKTDACQLLRNSTVLMIGDSFMRHVYTAVLTFLRSDVPYGPKRWNTTSVQRRQCRGDYIYQQSCSVYLDRDTRHCKNTTHLKFLEYIAARQSLIIREAIRQLHGIPNSYVLLGIGIHDNFNFGIIAAMLLHPLLEMLKYLRWPEVIWMSTHAPGLLKTPRVPSQSAESILEYNNKVKRLFQTSATPVPILDFYNLTKDTMSFDGAHYGRGVNEAKAQIFLNYILHRQRGVNVAGLS